MRSWPIVATTLGLLAASPTLAQNNTPREETWVTDGSVYAIATTPTTTYIGGDFGYVGPYTGSGVPFDATTGQPGAAYPKVNDYIYACVSDGGGGRV